MQETPYIPGMCNINKAEVAYRRKAMNFGIGLSVILFIVLFGLSVNVWIRATLLFIPVYIAAIGYLQVRNRFCVSYGANGRQNAEEGSKKVQAVNDSTNMKIDKRKARVMNIQAFLTTMVILLASLLMPKLAALL